MHQRCSHRFSREATIAASKHILNDEERIFVMLLILVLALLFCPSLAEEELRGEKQKNTLMGAGHTMCNEKNHFIYGKSKKKKEKAIPFRQKTHTQVP